MSKIPEQKLKQYIQDMISSRKERKFVETVDLQIGLKVIFIYIIYIYSTYLYICIYFFLGL